MTLSTLPPEILLRIFSFLLFPTLSQNDCDIDANDGNTTHRIPTDTASITTQPSLKKRSRSRATEKAKNQSPGARSLCRLCCCSKKINHIASADQLWQFLTLDFFPEKHWKTTDPKTLELIQTRQDHYQKLKALENQTRLEEKEKEEKRLREATLTTCTDTETAASIVESTALSTVSITGTSATPAPAKRFYSRFEQRAHRRRQQRADSLPDLDPGLVFSPLWYTNTFWSWKRTFFGDMRFKGAKEVRTPNRIDATVYKTPSDGQGQESRPGEKTREECGRCWRPIGSCICASLPKVKFCNCRIRILILQHPKCQVSIGTIRILKLAFRYCDVVIGKDFQIGKHAVLDQYLEQVARIQEKKEAQVGTIRDASEMRENIERTITGPWCEKVMLLYPSHDARDLYSVVADEASVGWSSFKEYGEKVEGPDVWKHPREQTEESKYFCNGCLHKTTADSRSDHSEQDQPNKENQDHGKAYPYKLIIALDGSWSHAKIMYRHNPRLQSLPQVMFPNPPKSMYHELKPEPKVTYTSTVEAVGKAVAVLGWESMPPPPSRVSSSPPAVTLAEQNDCQDSDADRLMSDLIRPLKTIIDLQVS